MNRRSFLTRAGAGVLLLDQAGRPAVQDTASAPRADRLYDPSVVQERSAATPLDNDPAIKDLEHRLKCTCGCNLDIYTCRTTDFTCTYSPALHREVVALWEKGASPDQIVEAFVAKYGESILMAPRPVGFNLAGYLVPGIAVAAGALVLAWILVRRGRRMEAVAAPPRLDSPTASANPIEDERLRQALADVDD
jgi:cytochrome c-type biogenesis protein CcmH